MRKGKRKKYPFTLDERRQLQEEGFPEWVIEELEYTRPQEVLDVERAKLPPIDSDPQFQSMMLKAYTARALTAAMKEQGITQNQLAERLGKSRQWVSRIMNEADNFTVATIAKLACAVGLVPKLVFEPAAEIQPARQKATGSRKIAKSKVKSVGGRKTTRIDKAATSVREAGAKYRTAKPKRRG